MLIRGAKREIFRASGSGAGGGKLSRWNGVEGWREGAEQRWNGGRIGWKDDGGRSEEERVSTRVDHSLYHHEGQT